jgi:hypothetical protein
VEELLPRLREKLRHVEEILAAGARADGGSGRSSGTGGSASTPTGESRERSRWIREGCRLREALRSRQPRM